jgi:hypothetical protein
MGTYLALSDKFVNPMRHQNLEKRYLTVILMVMA